MPLAEKGARGKDGRSCPRRSTQCPGALLALRTAAISSQCGLTTGRSWRTSGSTVSLVGELSKFVIGLVHGSWIKPALSACSEQGRILEEDKRCQLYCCPKWAGLAR